MATEQSTSELHPARPFQFTLRHILFAMVACSIWLAASVQFGVFGFFTCYIATCVIAITWGARRQHGALVLGGVAMLGFGFCTGLPLLGLSDGRGSARRASCQNNLHNIALALQQYEANNGCFPPPYIADANGKPMHSWRVLLLPYLDQRNLYKQYRFDEPWDGPNNSKLHSTVLKIYCCPAHSGKWPTTDTTYTAVVGPKTVWPEQAKHPIRMADVIDGLSATIVVVEVANSGIHWMEPRDLHVVQMPMQVNPARGQGMSSPHKNCALAVFADGHTYALTDTTPPEIIWALLTPAGGETIGDY